MRRSSPERVRPDMRPLRPAWPAPTRVGLPPLRPASADAAWSGSGRAAGATAAGLLLVALPVAAAQRYDGSSAVFILFEAAFTGMIALAVPRPRSYAFTFLAGLLFLGFWVKFNLHQIFDRPYQEPIGAFDGSGASWDRALLMASCGAVGVSLARLVMLAGSRRPRRPRRSAHDVHDVPAPDWFANRRALVWIATLVIALALSLANLAFAFYAIGVNPRLVLPMHGNVIVAWLIKLGLALWIATLVHWELRLAKARPDSVLLASIAEAAMASMSGLSRGLFLFRAIPYCVVLFERAGPLWGVGRRRLVTLTAVAVAGFVVSLGVASALRLLIYPASGVAQSLRSLPVADPLAAAPEAAAAAQRLDAAHTKFALREVRGLFVDRWNGMEGVMAVSSHDGLGGDLLIDALKEDPTRGQASIYQRISAANLVYAQRRGYTFLTLPGIVGVLGYSGSTGVVTAGMALLAALVLAIEGFFRRVIANRFVASLAGFAMGVELTQANFPYLLATFFVLLVLSLAMIAALTVGGPTRRKLARRLAGRGQA